MRLLVPAPVRKPLDSRFGPMAIAKMEIGGINDTIDAAGYEGAVEICDLYDE